MSNPFELTDAKVVGSQASDLPSSYDPIIQDAAAKRGMDPAWLRAHIQVESRGNPNAESEVGAKGLMQLMPETAKQLGVTDPTDPTQNINAGADYLKEGFQKTGTVAGAAAYYHGGPNKANWGPKTQDYVNKITSLYKGPGLISSAQAEEVPGDNPFQLRGVKFADDKQSDQPDKAVPEQSTLGRVVDTAKDTGIAVAGSSIDFARSLYGIADAVTLGHLDRMTKLADGEPMSEKFRRAQEIVREQYSDRTKQEMEEQSRVATDKDGGFFPALGFTLKHPDLAAVQLGSMASYFLGVSGVVRGAAERASGVAIEAATKAGSGAAEIAAAGRKAAAAAAEKAAVLANSAFMGGATALDTKDAVMALSHDDLLKTSPEYQKLIADGMSPDDAKMKLAGNAEAIAGVVAAVLTGAATKLTGTGGFYAKLFGGKLAGAGVTKGVAGFAGDTAKTAAEIGAQSAGNKFAENLGKQQTVDPDQSLSEGVAGAAGSGVATGALFGSLAHLGGAALNRGAPEAAPAPRAITFEDGAKVTSTPELVAKLKTIEPKDRFDAVAQALGLTEKEPAYHELSNMFADTPDHAHAVLLGSQLFHDVPAEQLKSLMQANQEATHTPDQATGPLMTPDAIKAQAKAHLDEIARKEKGYDEQVPGPDGKLLTNRVQPQYLTPEEKGTRDFLKANLNDHQALARAYGARVDTSPGVTVADPTKIFGAVKGDSNINRLVQAMQGEFEKAAASIRKARGIDDNQHAPMTEEEIQKAQKIALDKAIKEMEGNPDSIFASVKQRPEILNTISKATGEFEKTAARLRRTPEVEKSAPAAKEASATDTAKAAKEMVANPTEIFNRAKQTSSIERSVQQTKTGFDKTAAGMNEQRNGKKPTVEQQLKAKAAADAKAKAGADKAAKKTTVEEKVKAKAKEEKQSVAQDKQKAPDVRDEKQKPAEKPLSVDYRKTEVITRMNSVPHVDTDIPVTHTNWAVSKHRTLLQRATEALKKRSDSHAWDLVRMEDGTDERTVVASALHDLINKGMPEQIINRVRGFGSHHGERDSFGSWWGGSQDITLHQTTLLHAAQDNEGAQRVRGHLAHELGHAADRYVENGVPKYASADSPYFAMKGEGSDRLGTGVIFHEVAAATRNQKLRDYFQYPLKYLKDSSYPTSKLKQEMFAQLFRLYFTNQELLKQNVPTAHRLIEQVVRESRTRGVEAAVREALRPGGSAVDGLAGGEGSKNVEGGTRQERASGLVRQGQDEPGGAVLQHGEAERAGRETGAGTRGEAARTGAGAEGLQDAGRVRGSEGGLAAQGRPAAAQEAQPLKGLPSPVEIPGHGSIEQGPHLPAREAAERYMRAAGLPYEPPTEYAKLDPERASRVAKAFDGMPHNPSDPEVQRAYQKMIDETVAQYQEIKKTGLKIDFIDYAKDGDPYAASPRLAIQDVKENNHLWVFPTEDGFGSGHSDLDVKDNPLLQRTNEYINGKRLLANDVFRIVHDYFGHIKEGVGFRAEGEENAWRSHSAMYSPEARRAMTSETRGQNSWLNYGPHGERNRSAKSADTVFADQKIGLLPDWAVNEGARDTARDEKPLDFTGTGKRLSKEEKGASLDEFVYGNKPLASKVTPNIEGAASFLQNRALKANGGMNRAERTPENQKAIVRILTHEAMLAMQKGGNASKWYSKTLDKAMELASLIHPEIATDPEKRFAFSYALAVTSNGTDVRSNIGYAFKVYKEFLKKGEFPRFGVGERSGRMMEAFTKFNRLAKELGSFGEAKDFMLADHNVRDLRNDGYTSVRGLADEIVSGGAIIGRKIGGAFLQNLNGNMKPLTIDRWLMRTWGRVTADLLHEDGRLKDAPPSDKFRAWVTDTLGKVLDEMHSNGHDLQMADLQALLWYPEKELYNVLGAVDKRGIPTDYAIEVARYAKDAGKTDSRLDEALSLERGGRRGADANGRTGGEESSRTLEGKEGRTRDAGESEDPLDVTTGFGKSYNPGEIVNRDLTKAGDDFVNSPKVRENFFSARSRKLLDTLSSKFFNRMSPLGNLPEENKYLVLRGVTQGLIENSNDIAQGIGKLFAKASATDKSAIYDYLTNAYSRTSGITDPVLRAKAVEIKRDIIATGEKLVKRGLLSQTDFDAHRGSYLPRVYLKHLLNENDWRGIGAGKKPSDLGYTRKRQDIEESVRLAILGEIRDPAFLSALAVSKPARDIALFDFLHEISKNSDWVYPKTLVDFQGHQVTVHWLKNEADRIREQIPHYTDPAVKAEAEQHVKDMEDLYRPIIDGLSKEPKDYKQVPDTPRYGVLRGMYVRKEIHNDLLGVSHSVSADANWFEKLFMPGGASTKVTQIWKTMKVALNPPGQIRNIGSNLIMLNLSGIGLHMIPVRIAQAVKEIRTNGPAYQVAKKYGITAGSFANEELFRMERRLLNLKSGGVHSVFDVAGHISNVATDAYQMSETIGKVAKIIDHMAKGHDEATAALEAQKWLFDYSLVPGAVRSARNAPIGVPFMTYYYKVAPRLAEVAATRPWMFLPYVAAAYGLPALVAGQIGATTDDVENMHKLLVDRMREKGHVYLLPTRDGNGNWQFLDMSYLLPWGMFADAFNDLKAGHLGDFAKTVGLFTGPVVDTITAIKTNTDPFTGRTIANQGDPTALQVGAWLTYAYNMAAPPFLTNMGLIGPDLANPTGNVGGKIPALMGGTTNKYGDPKTTAAQTALSAVGINLYPVNPHSARSQNLVAMARDIEQVQLDLRQKLYDRALTPEQRQKIIDVYRDEIAQRVEKLKQYQRDTVLPESIMTKPE